MKLIPVPATHIDFAWQEGASALAEACETSGGEITGEQLKLILSRGERTLIRMEASEIVEPYQHPEGGLCNYVEKTVGWGVVRIDQLPNVRVLFVTDMAAHGAQFERFFEELKSMARSLGCSRIRCAAKPVQARLYRQKVGFTPVYEILEVSAL